MKKTIVLMAFAIATLSTVSCKNEKKATTPTEAKTDDHADHNHETDEKHLAYTCPMDCEKGKTYETAGKCPTCGMDLIEANHSSEETHEDHNH